MLVQMHLPYLCQMCCQMPNVELDDPRPKPRPHSTTNAVYRDCGAMGFPRNIRTPQILSSPPQSGDTTQTIGNVRSRVHILLRFASALEPRQHSDEVTTGRSQQPAGIGDKMSAALIGVHEILHQCVAIPMRRNEAPFRVRGIRQLETIGVSHGRSHSNRGT
jgi:hypothetical protein